MVHFDRNLLCYFDKAVYCPTSLHLCREFGKGIKMIRAIPLGLLPLLGSSRNASPPLSGEKRCVTTLITAAKEIMVGPD